MTEEELIEISKRSGYDFQDIEAYNGKLNKESNNVLEDLTDQEIYDKDATSITLVAGKTSIAIGEQTYIIIQPDPSISNVPDVIWDSTDSSVAYMMSNGTVVGYGVGETTITATDAYDPEVTGTIDITVYDPNAPEDGGDEGGDEPEPEPDPTPDPEPDPDPTPDPEPDPEPEPEPEPEETEATWEYIWNEETWNAAYAGETMQAYYTWADEVGSYPYKEDLWNEAEQRAANWNDIPKDESGQPIETDHGYEYIDSLGNPCVRCWLGAVNAPGAKYPWCVVTVPNPFEGTIKFVYDGGDPVYPWGEENRSFTRGFGIASIPTELGEEYLLDGDGNTTFDPTKLVVTLVPGSAE